MSNIEIGCCCAYCRTCRAFRGGHCRGCRLGYDSGQRDLSRARCRIKLCCLRDKKLQTCADCQDFETCGLLQGWYGKNAGKYRKYRESAEYIRKHGYDAFIHKAEGWKDACGPLK